ncbi:hypothetical protein F4677DRAFT_432735 [Hypoxylon crocopeplum]|nr:hypothetical protein F4677DRAFT_432735 [Hypoxylon crocopeplum]
MTDDAKTTPEEKRSKQDKESEKVEGRRTRLYPAEQKNREDFKKALAFLSLIAFYIWRGFMAYSEFESWKRTPVVDIARMVAGVIAVVLFPVYGHHAIRLNFCSGR